MTRLRSTFIVVGVVLFVLLGSLVWRAFESVRAERDLRHQIVAERVFDEMERELTALVRREEARPFEHYRSYYVPESSPLARVRSPLADPPAEPYIVGYFLVSPGGTVTTPRESIAPADLVRLQSIVSGRDELKASPEREQKQSPGTTLALSKTEQVEDDEGSGAYLRELNRGAAQRRDRDAKLAQSVATNLYDQQQALESRGASAPVDVVLGSFAGERVDESFIVLSRTASVGDASYRQGLVVHADRLVDVLAESVRGGGELTARFEIMPDTSSGRILVPAAFTYRHQFAEPFESLASLLALPSLPETGGAGFLYLLSFVTFAAGTAGLLGIYRMVATRVAFAERRQNFVSAVSHELKTPLTSIRMYGEMLRDGMVPDDDKRAHYYNVITNESERLTRLVNNVLELSKLERRDRSLNPVAGPVLPVLEEARDVLEPHAAREGFAIRLEVEPNLPEAVFDRDALLQVLFNLIDNAVKYSKSARSREIVLCARRREGALELSVRDHGPGVSEVHLKRVFEPFYRAESEMTRRSRGTGIGLALVRGLVEAMGGSVRGENGEAGGFVVRLTLPEAPKPS